MFPNSKHWHKIAFIILQRLDIRNVRMTHAIRGAEFCTDHTHRSLSGTAAHIAGNVLAVRLPTHKNFLLENKDDKMQLNLRTLEEQ